MEKILVTGGLGYIGSHTVVELHNSGYEPVIIDNLYNASIGVLDSLEKICQKRFAFEKIEMCNAKELDEYISRNKDIKGVIHFAAILQVKESVDEPVKYYSNNLNSTLNLINSLKKYEIDNLVFSSSCTVYGNPDDLPVTEEAPSKPAESPYGNTKKICEDILKDSSRAYDMNIISLRYFNPVGAHPSGIIGEVQHGEPHHLIPYITETAIGKRGKLKVFGNDYNTRDGSCIRDYIHVMDLANAHVKALRWLSSQEKHQLFEIFNIGSGNGNSVLEIIEAFKEATGIAINYEIVPRRPGDVEAVYANTKKAESLLNWRQKYTLADAMRDAWLWQNNQEDISS
ncbi:MAG: UDP-glucose 4-epimerase GalE [Bacteroidota bacterium]